MNICIFSGITRLNDEGMKNFAYNIEKQLSLQNSVLHLNIKENILRYSFWNEIRSFNPSVVHIFLRPTFISLLIGKLCKLACKNSKIIFSALQPPISKSFFRLYMPFLRPDAFFIQSESTELFLKKNKCSTFFVPSGVDLEKFKPVSFETKLLLRKKYNIDEQKFVILHVGHINKGRNLQLIIDLIKKNNYPCYLVIGSVNSYNFDEDIHIKLIESGCIVKREYFKNIEELYQLSDCYIFPTIDSSYAIEIPFSILEAMACDLPVISTPFGGLKKIFNTSNSITFVKSFDEALLSIEKLRINGKKQSPRSAIKYYSWDNISRSIEVFYQNLINGGNNN